MRESCVYQNCCGSGTIPRCELKSSVSNLILSQFDLQNVMKENTAFFDRLKENEADKSNNGEDQVNTSVKAC